MNDLVLDDFAAADIDELVPMWRASFEAGVGITDPHPLAEQHDYFWADVAPKNRIRVARSHGQLVGFVAASAVSIAQLYVRVGHQRRGIGSALVAWSKAQSSGRLTLWTFAQNTRARAFYEKHGFKAAEFGFEPHWRLADVRYEWSEPRFAASGSPIG